MNQRVRCLILFLGVSAACAGTPQSPTQPSQPALTPAPQPGNPETASITVSGVARERIPGTPYSATNKAGLPLKDVVVKVYPKYGGTLLTSTTTDSEGRYSVKVVRTSPSIPQIYMSFDRAAYTGDEKIMKDVAEDQTSADALLEPHLRTLTGLVTNDSGVPLAAADVEVLTGSNKGLKVKSDVSGTYTVSRVWGDFDFQVSTAGYNAKTQHASLIDPVSRVDVALSTTDELAHSVFTGRLCTVAPGTQYDDCWGSSFPYPTEVHHAFFANRPGTLTLSVSYNYVGDYYGNSLHVRLTCDGEVVFERNVNTGPGGTSSTDRINLSRACTYDVGLSNYIADRKGGDWTTYRIDAGYPK